MTQALQLTLARFTGGSVSGGERMQGAESWARRSDPVAVILGGEPNTGRDAMAQNGDWQHRQFVVLPSASEPRWLLPLCDASRVRGGFEIYTPYAPMARLLKSFTIGLLRAGWKGSLRDRILVTSQEPLPLERLVTDVTGERRPMFALSLGNSSRFRKLAVQVMRPSGETLGYIKLPMDEGASERIRHEASMLEGLWAHPVLRPHLPRVLHAGVWENGYLLFQSAGPGAAGEVHFGPAHDEFLSNLWRVRRTDKPGSVLVAKTAERWKAVAPRLDSSWRDMGDEVLRRASASLGERPVACGILHGDFAPWNTRGGRGSLFVYDWESAEWDAPLGWDVFHFHVQVASLLNRHARNGQGLRDKPREHSSLLLYLLHSACASLEEGSQASRAVEYRRQLLAKELGRSTGESGGPPTVMKI